MATFFLLYVTEGIPLGSRVIGVCDAFHAMTEDRVYRKALRHDEAVADKIVEIHAKHGLDVVICLQEWLANELTYEVADGWKWNSGFASSDFITDQPRQKKKPPSNARAIGAGQTAAQPPPRRKASRMTSR